MQWLESLILGVVQGLTEFLPVSSDGHLSITQHAFDWWHGRRSSGAENLFFDVMLHVGTLAAIVLHYRAVVITGLKGLLGSNEVPPEYRRPAVIRVGWLAFVATLPLIPLALFLKKWIEAAFQSVTAAGVGFLITAAVLLVTTLLRKDEKGKGPAETTWLDALLIGLAQMFAPLPGVSRSGLTVASALALGLSRSWAVGFSLLIAVPAILGATVLELSKLDPATMTPDRAAQTVAAAVVAGLVGYGAIIWLVKIVRSGRLWYFSVYLVVLATAVLTLVAVYGEPSMPSPESRTLWTGPHGSKLRERLLDEAPGGPSGIWVVPSDLARERVTHALGLKFKLCRDLRVWTWDGLWREVRHASATGPALLSPAATRAALGQAIARGRADGVLDAVAEVIEWPGFRRRLRARISTWTRDERPIEAPPPGNDPGRSALWAIFVRYRAILRRLDAEDAEGFAVWASKRLASKTSGSLFRDESVTFLEPEPDSRAAWRVLEHAHASARSMAVTLTFDPEPELAEAHAEAAAIRDRLVGWGFVETVVEPDPERPSGLRGVEAELFRADAHRRDRITSADGLTVLGAPQGEGVGLVVARAVKRLLAEGADPEAILVLVRAWDEDAEVVLETLRAWGLPVAGAPPRPLSAEPAVSALRLAARLPVEGWETEHLIQLLRNGQVRPAWAPTPHALAVAASSLQSSRAFRGLKPIRRALDRDPAEDTADSRGRARMVRNVVEPLLALIEPIDQSRTWPEQVDQLRNLADGLGLGSPDDRALHELFDALNDHGAVLERLGRADGRESWKAFTSEVEGIVGELTMPAREAPPGTIRMATVDEVAGARADHVILANLAEGTFPTREAIDPRLTVAAEDGEPTRPDAAFGREIRRFLRVVGSADLGVVLAYPTGDEQGQELLRAGFLDDLLGRLSDEANRACHSADRRFDPALVDHPDLAGAPADARVRAVALACGKDDRSALVSLSRLAAHRPALEGVAGALRVSAARTQSRAFGRFDGRLSDEAAIRKIADDFGPGRTFSPSQLESFLFCPFQFFLRYVLKLEPIDERNEIDEDYTGRGSRVHSILEELEQLHTQEHADRLDLARRLIESPIRPELSEGSNVDLGLDQIDQRRLARTIRKYARQHETYEAAAKALPPVPHRFEVAFGDERIEESYPGLVLGEGDESVRLMGKIDRIDLLQSPTGSAFRVIDYKTGKPPAKKDVKEALYVQLPLYALAVERIVLEHEAAVLHDVGYWGLGDKGFTSIALKDWEHDREALVEFVVRVVGQLRQGVFAVDSRKGDCNHRCEHSAVCRFAEVRASGKARDDAPRLEIQA